MTTDKPDFELVVVDEPVANIQNHGIVVKIRGNSILSVEFDKYFHDWYIYLFGENIIKRRITDPTQTNAEVKSQIKTWVNSELRKKGYGGLDSGNEAQAMDKALEKIRPKLKDWNDIMDEMIGKKIENDKQTIIEELLDERTQALVKIRDCLLVFDYFWELYRDDEKDKPNMPMPCCNEYDEISDTLDNVLTPLTDDEIEARTKHLLKERENE